MSASNYIKGMSRDCKTAASATRHIITRPQKPAHFSQCATHNEINEILITQPGVFAISNMLTAAAVVRPPTRQTHVWWIPQKRMS